MLIVGLSLLAVSAFATPKRVAPISKGKKAFLAGLIKRCENGIATSCYDYGVSLSRSKSAKERQKGISYIRRACTLAYAPACKQKTSTLRGQTVVTSTYQPCDMSSAAASIQVAGDLISSVVQGSIWYRAGAMAGDKVTSINDKTFHGYNQIAEALGTGSMVLNVERNGKPTSLMVSCP